MTDFIQRLGRLARERSGDVDAATDRRSRDALIAALPQRRPRPWTWSQRALAAACVVMAAVIVLLVWPEQRLAYQVAGALADDGYVRAASEPASILFEDGTRFEIGAQSSSRVVDVGANGARVLLESGKLTADVVPRANGKWAVVAGPYTISVTGTRFDVQWSAADQRFAVQLIEGSIVVRGPMAEQGITMAAGQHLAADVDRRALHVTDGEAPTASTPSAPPAASVGASPPPSSRPSATATAAAPAPAPASWSQLNARGAYAEVMDRARAMGIESVLSGGSIDQLVALGDAARYTGDGATSRNVLLALRKRFPSSAGAKTAAFLLGRMAEGGSPATAITWYDRYLAESPGGTYAAEALGRKMVVLSRTQPARARAIAAQYLKLYPRGGYAEVARRLAR